MRSTALTVTLTILALTLVIFGGWRLLDPVGFYTFSGLELPDAPGLLSEVRAAGAVIMAAGVVVGLGVLRPAWSRTAAALAAVVFLGLGLGRLLGMALDGSPGSGVVQGMVIELVLGVLALGAFIRHRDGHAVDAPAST